MQWNQSSILTMRILEWVQPFFPPRKTQKTSKFKWGKKWLYVLILGYALSRRIVNLIWLIKSTKLYLFDGLNLIAYLQGNPNFLSIPGIASRMLYKHSQVSIGGWERKIQTISQSVLSTVKMIHISKLIIIFVRVIEHVCPTATSQFSIANL